MLKIYNLSTFKDFPCLKINPCKKLFRKNDINVNSFETILETDKAVAQLGNKVTTNYKTPFS